MKAIPLIFCLLGCASLLAQPASPVRLLGYQLSECDSRIYPERLLSRVVQQQWRHDTLDLTLGSLYLSCDGLADSLQVSVVHDTLYIREWVEPIMVADTIQQGDSSIIAFLCEPQKEADCGCCFEITFSLTGLMEQPSRVWLENQFLQYHPVRYKYKPTIPSYNISYGDTTDHIDQWGWKQGYAESCSKNDSIISMFYFIDDEATSYSIFHLMPSSKLNITYEQSPRGVHALFGPDGAIIKDSGMPPEIIAIIRKWYQAAVAPDGVVARYKLLREIARAQTTLIPNGNTLD